MDYNCLKEAGEKTIPGARTTITPSAISTDGPNSSVITNAAGLSSAIVPMGNNVAGVAGEDPGKKTVTVATIGSQTDPAPGQKAKDLLDTYLTNQRKLGCTP